jgi:1-phosphofructokinase family hexose kinase
VILAAGLTPAWQQIMRFDGFRPGEVNRAIEVHRCASGKVLNVAVALAHLGTPCTALAPLGGPALDEIEREFSDWGICRRWIEVAAPTRVCTTILDSGTRAATELVENAPAMTASEVSRFADAFAELAAGARMAVLSGSLAEGVEPTFFHDLARAAPCPLLLDVRGPELLAALGCRPLVVKPNRDELARTLGRDLTDDEQLRLAMAELNDRGAQWVVVSTGARPVWASSQGRYYRFQPSQVDVVNPIGSGDCLAAGIAWGLVGGLDPLSAIGLGIAAAAENVRQLLPARLDRARVQTRGASIHAENVYNATTI